MTAVTPVQHIQAHVLYTSLTTLGSIWDPTMQRNINNSWICLLGGPEDDLIRPKHVALTKVLFLYINIVFCYQLTCCIYMV